MNWQAFLGAAMTTIAGGYLVHRYNMPWLDCAILLTVGIGGLIYGDA